jgi:hypothetical protein
MKQTMNTIVKLVVFLGMGSIQAFAAPFAKGPYLGQTPPGSTAQVFAPGLICNTGQSSWEAFGTFSADGNTFCFHRRKGIFITENTDKGWTAPKRIESITQSHWAPCLSPDANSVFFTNGDRYPRVEHYDLYRCNRTSHGWAKPQILGSPLSSPSNEITCSLAANNSIYLGSGRKGNDERSWIWVAPSVGNTWPRADHISLNLRQPLTKHGPVSGGKTPFVDHTWPRAVHFSLNHQASDPGIAPDESFMVFTAKDLSGGYGHRDLYLSVRLPDGTWSKPRNLGPKINTAYIEHGGRISPDKKYLFFNRSNGWDPGIHAADIYWVELKEYLPESYR